MSLWFISFHLVIKQKRTSLCLCVFVVHLISPSDETHAENFPPTKKEHLCAFVSLWFISFHLIMKPPEITSDKKRVSLTIPSGCHPCRQALSETTPIKAALGFSAGIFNELPQGNPPSRVRFWRRYCLGKFVI